MDERYADLSQHLDIQASQGKIEAHWYGSKPDEAPTLVLLHEGLGCAQMWKEFPQQLAQQSHCGVLVYSRAGYGNSTSCALPRPFPFMHHEASQALPEILDLAGVKEFILIGHSDGGSIALLHAGLNPRRGLLGVVTLAAHLFVEALTLESIRAAKVAWETTDLRERLRRYHGDNVDCAFRGWNDVWLNPDFENWNIEGCLAGIKVPVLAIQGVDDQYGTVEQIDRIVAGTGASKRMLANCAHSPQLEQTQATLEAIVDFTGKLTGHIPRQACKL